jgi:hypothetical protein
MAIRDRRWDHFVAAILLAGSGIFLAGCATGKIPRLSAGGSGWKVQQGQAIWKAGRGRPELGGDLILATTAADVSIINFSKTPLPIINGQRTGTNWLVEFPAKKWTFGGGGEPPKRFGWLYLPDALAGRPIPERFHFEQKPDGTWRLENTRSGEVIAGYLLP